MLAQTFTRAFADDPVFCWLYRDEATRESGLAALFTIAVEAGLRRGTPTRRPGDEPGASGRLRVSSCSTAVAASDCWTRW